MNTTTIAAISTPSGLGGIAVLRVSGADAISVVGRVFRPHRGSLETLPGYSCLYGRVFDRDGELDDAVLTLFRAPHSYTGEDTVELSVHGGTYLPGQVLHALLDAGAVPAEGGEFTRRACENGKLDLTQAEAVMDLIGAQGRVAAKAALAARDGALYRALTAPTETLLSLDAHLSAYIDFPEEDVPELHPDVVLMQLNEVVDALEGLLATEKPGRQLRQGLSAAIVGRPNVGKSSLMNLLAGYRRSIVTSTPGTTRDVIEEYVSLDGLTLRLADTAGIRDTADPIEREGVMLAEARLRESDIILAVFDLSQPPNAADLRVISACADVSRETPVVAVFNKSDLTACPETLALREQFCRSVVVSAEQRMGADQLWDSIRDVTRLSSLDPNAAMLATERQRQAARTARDAAAAARDAVSEGWTLDVASIPVSESLEALLELRGDRLTDTLLDRVFETFCVGK